MPLVYSADTDKKKSSLLSFPNQTLQAMAGHLPGGSNKKNCLRLAKATEALEKEILRAIIASKLGLINQSINFTRKLGTKQATKTLKLSIKLQDSISELRAGFFCDYIESNIYTSEDTDYDEKIEMWENIDDHLNTLKNLISQTVDNANTEKRAGRLNKLKGFTEFVGLFAAIYEQESKQKFTFNPHYNADGVYTKGQEFIMTASTCLYTGGFKEVPPFTEENFQSACSYAIKDMDRFRKTVKKYA